MMPREFCKILFINQRRSYENNTGTAGLHCFLIMANIYFHLDYMAKERSAEIMERAACCLCG